ncbi:hypothetical protein VE01_01230 [Pseudogymnoascus verrucosus]|uniref:F-box domain-containing protein n=1 Tax=Pseudogymnoascus verrucosus TaxID=342668 RepID=A0A1B8GY65_9PEZI|nr:uncharacterized protein VE01_01230 [Pseudogymnoascus verrucosus]OBU00766.1 hypothetical protein VE01_01230 [Pseudogymnoascus verrucosus]
MEAGLTESHIEDSAENIPPTSSTLPPLPNELLTLILTFLPTTPNSHLIASTTSLPLLPNTPHPTPLKSASLVSRTFRHAALPLLFGHPRLFIQYQDDILASLLPLLAFLTAHNLAPIVSSFVLFEDWVSDHERLPRPRAEDFWDALFAVIAPETVLITTLPLVLPYFLGEQVHGVDVNLTTEQYGSVLLERGWVGEVERTERGRRPKLLLGKIRAKRLPALMGVLEDNAVAVRRLWYTTFEGETKMF